MANRTKRRVQKLVGRTIKLTQYKAWGLNLPEQEQFT